MRDAYYAWDDAGSVVKAYEEKFLQYVNDDLNTSRVIALIWELIKDKAVTDADKKATVTLFDEVLGLQLAEWAPAAAAEIPDEIMALAKARQEARAAKDWAAADAARDGLAEKGYEVVDTPDGFEVRRV